jgi:surface antigen
MGLIPRTGAVQRATRAAAVCAMLAAGSPAFAQQKDEAKPENPRPRITLTARPPIGTSIEWDWGDDTRSESTVDCEPYEAGKSQIRRRFTIEHIFRRAGAYKVFFRLKRRDKAVGNQSVTIQIRPGGPPEWHQ